MLDHLECVYQSSGGMSLHVLFLHIPSLEYVVRRTDSIRYFSPPPKDTVYPPEVHDYNDRFTELLQNIKKRHDPTVTTVAQGVLDWKRKRGAGRIDQSVQEWLDRFYMSRIGIRFLIGQRESTPLSHLSCSILDAPATLPFTLPISCLADGSDTDGIDVALNTLQPHNDYVGIICTRAVSPPPSPTRAHLARQVRY